MSASLFWPFPHETRVFTLDAERGQQVLNGRTNLMLRRIES
jgi:hypothetical protein